MLGTDLLVWWPQHFHIHPWCKRDVLKVAPTPWLLQRRKIINENKSFLLYFSRNHLLLTCRDIPGKNIGGKTLDKAKSCPSALELNSPTNGFNFSQKCTQLFEIKGSCCVLISQQNLSNNDCMTRKLLRFCVKGRFEMQLISVKRYRPFRFLWEVAKI